jgi:hypothetical protein
VGVGICVISARNRRVTPVYRLRRTASGKGFARGGKSEKAQFPCGNRAFGYGLAVTYFRVRNCTLSSAQTRFTVLFGMGRRGSRLLWPPD